jgi:hypothetical protein
MQTVGRSLLVVALAASALSAVSSKAQDQHLNEAGAVFVMNNSVARNEIISFK